MLNKAHSTNSYFDYDNQCWIVGGKVERCGHPENMNCGCYGRLHAGEIATAAQDNAWKGLLVSMFIEHHGAEYMAAHDKWVLVDDFLAGQNYADENLSDEIDDKVFDKLYPEGDDTNYRRSILEATRNA